MNPVSSTTFLPPVTGLPADVNLASPDLTEKEVLQWMLDHYKEYVSGGFLSVKSLEKAVVAQFGGQPNPALHEYVADFALDLQEAALRSLNNAAPDPEPCVPLLSVAEQLGFKYDYVYPGTSKIPASWQFTKMDAVNGYRPSINIAVNEPHPVSRLRDLVNDALRKHAEMQPTL